MKPAMTMIEAQAAKRRCEMAILSAIRDFQLATELNVAGIDWTATSTIDSRLQQIVDIELRVTIS